MEEKIKGQIYGDRVLVKLHVKEKVTGLEVGNRPKEATVVSVGQVVRGDKEVIEVGQEVLIDAKAPELAIVVDGETYHVFSKHSILIIL